MDWILSFFNTSTISWSTFLNHTPKLNDDLIEYYPVTGYKHIKTKPVSVRNVLSKTECEVLIEQSEELKYEKALVNVGFGGKQAYKPFIRDSWRILRLDKEFADLIWERIKFLVPVDAIAGCNPVGINEQIRILKYDTPGQGFVKHKDSSRARPNSPDFSYWTVLLYLNDEYEGCWTRLYNKDNENFIDVKPEPGLILLHDHKYLHSATPLQKGCKYVMRMEVMFKFV